MFKNKKYVFESVPSQVIPVSSDIKISAVTNLREFREFYKVPWLIYDNDAYWVPPLWIEFRNFYRKKNPFWHHSELQLFIAYKANVAVGRIAAFIDHLYSKSEEKKVGFFGFFECIKDYRFASALLMAAQDWLADKGISLMQGPINGRVDVGCGFLYEGFGSVQSLLSSYSPKYYIEFAERFGMKKSRDLLNYYLDLRLPIPKYLEKASKRCKEQGIKIRGFNRLRAGKEMKWWIELMMEAFSEHWGYIPISEEEVKTRFGVHQARWIVDTGLFLVAELNNQPIAFKWSTPDYNQVIKKLNGKLDIIGILKLLWNLRRIDRGKFNLVGVKREYRRQGIGNCLNYYTMLEMKKRGYIGAEIGWIDEHNIANLKTVEKTGAKPYKRYRIYEKNIP